MDELTKLFAAYKEAVPDPEPGPAFMPELWRRIESCRSPLLVFRRFAQVFATAAVGFALLIGSVVIPRMQNAPVYNASYVDVLANEHTGELAYADLPQSQDHQLRDGDSPRIP
jgi:hypothetical protein